jgi:hypothetical protein
MLSPAKSAEARRILDRYVVEVVVGYELCPWARSAHDNGEIGVELIEGEPSLDAWVEACERALANPQTRVAMIVAPELAIELAAFRDVRDRVAARLPAIGIAEFHPAARLDLATPARLVPFLRRSPDPLLQCVPLSLLDHVRASPLPDRAQQAQILRGIASPPRDVATQLAANNHATVTRDHAAIEAVLDDIARDRRDSYARVSACR